MAHKAAKMAREHIDVPWDELRAARVRKRALEDFINNAPIEGEFEDVQPLEERDEPYHEQTEHVEPSYLGPSDIDPSSDDSSDIDSSSDDSSSDDKKLIASIVRPMGLGGKRWWMMAAALFTAAAVLLFVQRRTLFHNDPSEAASAGHTAGRPGGNWTVTSTLRYADGSRSLLGHGAQVEVKKDTAAAVSVKQAAGKVRYEVKPRQQRQFVVSAGGVQVTVVGTVFEVSVGERRVHVRVQRGKVRVQQGERVVQLVAGEHIAMDATASRSPHHSSAHHSSAHHSSAHAKPSTEDAPQEAAATPAAAGAPPTSITAATAATGGGAASGVGVGGAAAVASADKLMRAADQARAAGNLGQAARVLRELVRLHPRDRRVTVALFTLGKVERQRGQWVAAAQAFEQCGTALRGDALAAAANAWLTAGNASRARGAASRYLQHFPDGVHAVSMRGIVK